MTRLFRLFVVYYWPAIRYEIHGLISEARMHQLIAIIGIFIFADAAAAVDEDFLGLKPRRLVLSVGVSKFDDPAWSDLRFSPKDAADIHRFFTAEAGFDGGQVIGGMDGAEPGRVSLDSLKKGMTRLKEANRNEEDTVVVYFSTHGSLAEKARSVERYVLTSDSRASNFAGTALSYGELLDWFQSLPSRKKVLILAFCHSGTGKSVLSKRMRARLLGLKGGFYAEPLTSASEGSVILSASGWREPAREDARLKNDLYTHFLLKGFRQDANGDGAVSVMEAHSWAARMTWQYSGGQQRPSALSETVGEDPIVVSGEIKNTGRAMLYAYLARNTDLLVRIDGKDKGTVSKGVAMSEGRVRLTLLDPQNQEPVLDRVVRFEAGKEYSIGSFLHPEYPHSFTLGASALRFNSPYLRKRYAPGISQGIRMGLMRDDYAGFFDIGISLTYYPEQRETFRSAGQDQRFVQKRSTGTATLILGWHDRIRILSFRDNSLATQVRYFTGPSLLLYDRTVEDEPFLKREATSLTAGVMAGASLELLIPWNLLRAGVGINAGYYGSFAGDGPDLISSLEGGAWVGTFW